VPKPSKEYINALPLCHFGQASELMDEFRIQQATAAQARLIGTALWLMGQKERSAKLARVIERLEKTTHETI
jgi:hypothetical protein